MVIGSKGADFKRPLHTDLLSTTSLYDPIYLPKRQKVEFTHPVFDTIGNVFDFCQNAIENMNSMTCSILFIKSRYINMLVTMTVLLSLKKCLSLK